MKRREYLTSVGKVSSSGNIEHTFCTSFLLPAVGYCRKEFNNRLINVHIDKDFRDPALILIIDYTPGIEESIERLKKNKIYDSYLIEDSEVAIRFKVPYKYHDNFYKFLDGKYSEFDNEYKQILININGRKVNSTSGAVTIYDTIFPRKDKIKQIAEELNVSVSIMPKEVFDPPNLDYEVYKTLQELQEEQQTTRQEIHE